MVGLRHKGNHVAILDYLINSLGFKIAGEGVTNKNTEISFVPYGPYVVLERDLWAIFVYPSKQKLIGLDIRIYSNNNPNHLFRGYVQEGELPLVLKRCTNLTEAREQHLYVETIEAQYSDWLDLPLISKYHLWRIGDIMKARVEEGTHFVVPDDVEYKDAVILIENHFRNLIFKKDDFGFDQEEIENRKYQGALDPMYFDSLREFGINYLDIDKGKLQVIGDRVREDKLDVFNVFDVYALRLLVTAIKTDRVREALQFMEETDLIQIGAAVKDISDHVRVVFRYEDQEREIRGDLTEIYNYLCETYGKLYD